MWQRGGSGRGTGWLAAAGLALLAGCGTATAGQLVPGAASLGSVPGAASGPGQTRASNLLHKAISAIDAVGSVHLAIRATSGSRWRFALDDVAAHSFRLAISISDGGQATIIQVGGMAYVRGNEAALANYFKFPLAAARLLNGRWISVRPSDTGYAQLTGGSDYLSVADEVRLGAPLTLTGRSTVAGHAVVGVHGTVPSGIGAPLGSTATIYIAASGRPLPVRYVTVYGSVRLAATYTQWGERVHLTAPQHAIPIASLKG